MVEKFIVVWTARSRQNCRSDQRSLRDAGYEILRQCGGGELETVNDLHAPAIGKYRMRSALALTLMIAQAFLFNAVLVFLRTSADEVS
jgi:hypothetical protein